MNFSDLTSADIRALPFWRFTNNDDDELEIEPLHTVPPSPDGLIVGAQVTFSDRTEHWATLQNLSERPQWNEHFLTITIERRGGWLPLARYHDFDHASHGPKQLAAFMNKSVDSIFPIHYDLRELFFSTAVYLVGDIDAKPRRRLTRKEILAAVRNSLDD